MSRLVFEVIIGCRLEVTGILSSTTRVVTANGTRKLAEWRVMSQHASGVTVFVTTSYSCSLYDHDTDTMCCLNFSI